MRKLLFGLLCLITIDAAAQYTIPKSGVHNAMIRMPGQSKDISITGEIRNGDFIVDGDINMGTASKFFGIKTRSAAGSSTKSVFSPWKDGIIPYEISAT